MFREGLRHPAAPIANGTASVPLLGDNTCAQLDVEFWRCLVACSCKYWVVQGSGLLLTTKPPQEC